MRIFLCVQEVFRTAADMAQPMKRFFTCKSDMKIGKAIKGKTIRQLM